MSINTQVRDLDDDLVELYYDADDEGPIFLTVNMEEDELVTSLTATLDGKAAHHLGVALIRAAYEMDCL